MPPPILPAIPRISREKTTIMSTMGSTQDSSTDRMGLMGSTYSGPKLVTPCSSSRETRSSSRMLAWVMGAQK